MAPAPSGLQEGEAQANEIETNAAIRHRGHIEAPQDQEAPGREGQEAEATGGAWLSSWTTSDRVAAQAKLRRNEEDNAQLQSTLKNRRQAATEREQPEPA